MKEYNPGKFLRELFPEQTSSPAQILKWLVLYLANVALVFLAIVLLLFSGEIALWNRIKKRKREE